MHQYEFTSVSFKQLKKLPKNIQSRIIKKLDFYCQQSNPLLYADLLIDHQIGQFRFCIGNYRVVFDREENVFIVLAIGHRRDIYR